MNLVDVPGYQDPEGRDSEHLDKMTDVLRKECPKIDMFVLCFESGTKFDTGIQEMIRIYMNFLNANTKIWKNMIIVITKLRW